MNAPIDLLRSLAVEKKSISSKISQLLFNSFFPLDQNEDCKIERCIFLIKNDMEASRKFYLYIEKNLNLHDAVKFMLAILVQLKRQILSQEQDQEDKENQSENETLKDGSIRLANDTLKEALSDDLVVQGK